MKGLYIVTLEAEVVVLAESREDAMKIADQISKFDFDLEAGLGTDLTYLPGDWDEGCIPFGESEDKTIAEWVAAGAAPLYERCRAGQGAKHD